jgi:signal transduction histidine kinase
MDYKRDTAFMGLPSENVLQELTAALARLRQGDLGASVSFAGQDGVAGKLGDEFNQAVRALRERQGSGGAPNIRRLVHDLKNPLAGIAGAIEIMAQDLPEGSPSREILPELRAEIEHINQILADFAQGK